MKRALKIFGITLGTLVGIVLIVVGVAVYLIFTPARLTPIVRQVADKYVTCEHEVGEVDLTFFSTFPYFGVSVKDVMLVNPKAGAQNDTLLVVPEVVASVKLMDALDGDIRVKCFYLKDAKANVYIAPDGTTNFDVFDLTSDTTQKEDTVPGWQLRSLAWDEDIKLNARAVSFVDERDSISASLSDVGMTLSAIEKNKMEGACLDLAAQHISASYKGASYADDLALRLHLPVLLADGTERVIIDGTRVQVNEFALTLDGEAGTPCFSSGEYTMDVTLKTGNWHIPSVLALVPAQFTQALADVDIDGRMQLEAAVKGTYNGKQLPHVQARVTLRDGEGSYKPLPYELRELALNADVDLGLNEGERSKLTLHKLTAKTKETRVSAKGTIDNLLGDMYFNMALDVDANIPDFAYFMPQTMTLSGRASGKAGLRMRMSDLTAMRLEKGVVNADLNLTDIHYQTDSMVADLPKTHMLLQMPNRNPSAPAVKWARVDMETEKLDFSMATPLKAALQQSAICIETGNMLSDDPVIYAAVDLQTEQPIGVETDSMAVTLASPKIKAYAEYNIHDTTVVPVLKASLDCRSLNGYFNELKADLGASQLSASISGGRTDKSVPVMRAKLNTQAADVRMGEELKAKTGTLALEASSRYNAGGENLLLQWNPRLKVNLKDGALSIPERLPETVKIPSIEFGYSNREMNIENSRIELGNSDLNLKGNVRNMGKWFRHESILEGELDIISDHCDANQLLTWFSADKGSEETTNDQLPVTKDSTKTESEPFLVPTDVDLSLSTHIREVEIFNQVAKDLKGGLYVKDGKLILDEMGFVCRAAKLQLTAIYRTPRRNHLYVGFDYHMIDVDIDELITMIPNLEEMMPMLSSFKGAAQFHLAAETYMNSKYEPKLSTLRGASSLTGKDLVVLDGKTFSKISKLLLFRKKTENKIDSLNAEITVYKNQIDIYPLCVQMDKYMVALGGRHKTDMTFDYDINVLKPIYLGVHVNGTLDNLKIRLAKCKYAKDFRPHWYQKADTQSLELRQMIKQSMEKNVRIKSDQQ